MDILSLLAEGYTYGQMSRQLHISEATIKYHAKETYFRLGANNAAHAVARGYEKGILPMQKRLF